MNIRKLSLSIILFLGGFISLYAQTAELSQTSRTEAELEDEETIAVTMTGNKFVRYDDTLHRSSFILHNAPASLEILSITVLAAPEDSVADIVFTCTDFDETYSNFYVEIHDSVTDAGSSINTTVCTLVPRVEKANLSSNPLPLDEQNMTTGTARLIIDVVSPEEFVENNDLVPGDFELINFPATVTITDVPVQTKPTMELEISYAPGAFDDPIYDARVAILDPARLKVSLDSIVSDTILINGYTESVDTLSTSNLDEWNLNNAVIVVELTNDLATTGDLTVGTGDDIELVNFPGGVTATANSTGSQITVDLDFDYSDFDLDDNDGQIQVNSTVLTYNTDSDLLTPVGRIKIAAHTEIPKTTLDPDVPLNELNLDGRVLTVKLEDDWITNQVAFESGQVSMVPNATSNLSISGVAVNDSSEFEVTLSHSAYEDLDGSDFNLELDILDTYLFHSVSNLISDTTLITVFIESPSATLTPDVSLEEYSLSGRYLDVKLTQEWITDTSTFVMGDLGLRGAPSGMKIDSILVSDSSLFRVYLGHQYVDFDTDSNLRLTIDHNVLFQSGGPDSLVSVGENILAKLEKPRAEITVSGADLEEYELRNRTIDVALVDEWITSALTLPADLSLVSAPEGLGIVSITPGDSANFSILVTSSYYDFDTDSLLRLSINKDKLLQSQVMDLVSDSAVVAHVLEVPTATLTPVPLSPLREYNIDGRILLIKMDSEWLIDTADFDETNLTLVDAPAGISIVSAVPSDTNEVIITLSDAIVDFDDNAFMKIAIDSSKLVQSITIDTLISDTTLVVAYEENPEAFMTPTSQLREYFLETIKLDIEFSEEVFNGTSLNTAHFRLLNAPVGLSINGLESEQDSSITLLLAYDNTNPLNDFDLPYSNVMVAITKNVLIQTEEDSLKTDPFTILPNIEPVIQSVSIENESMMINDVVEAGITLAEYADSVYTLTTSADGYIGGYKIDSVEWESFSQYKAWFTVAEGGNDYLASESIPVSGVQLDDLPVTGVPYSGSIDQGSDLLDANRPIVQSLSIIGEADKQIGDEVILLISAFEEDLLPEDTTEINFVQMSEDNMVFDEIGGGTYTLTYTVEANDQNVAEGDLEAKIYLRDLAGNINEVYPLIDANTLTVDASVPKIDSIKNITATDTVIIGGEVILEVYTDEAGYSLSDDSEVNGVTLSSGLTFEPSGGILYEVIYSVEENDPLIAVGDLEAMIILVDSAGNRSDTVSDILYNDVAVLTVRPIALLTGNDEICVNDTATLYVTLDGTPPYRIKYHNSTDDFYIDSIMVDDYTLLINPTQTNTYSIDSVWDATGNNNVGTGGNSLVKVNPLPVVSILNLEPVYAVTDTNGVTLQGDPHGGDFFGPGVITQTSFFSPPEAGLTGGVPHEIIYEYTDANTCFNTDTQEVQIVQADVEFYWPNEPYNIACYLNTAYTLSATNIDYTLGSFSIEDGTYPPGFLTDNGDNTVTFNPSILPWTSGTDYKEEFVVRYDYLDKDGVPLFEKEDLVIEFFDTAYIQTELTDMELCSDGQVIDLLGSRTTNDIFSGPGVVDLGSFNYEFNSSLADTGENWIYYTYETPNKCVQQDSAMIVVHETPTPEFEDISACILSEGGEISFMNISDTTGLEGTLEWVWNYGDPQSGSSANIDTLQTMDNASHVYPGPGRRTVTLTATVLETLCASSREEAIDFGNTPAVSIGWDTECFTGNETQFSGTSITVDGDSLFTWKISELDGTVVIDTSGYSLTSLAYNFAVRNNYHVEFTAITENECQASVLDTIYLRPYIRNITDDSPYIEDFEDDAPGWIALKDETSLNNSWKLAVVNAGEFPYDLPGEGSKAWYTDIIRRDTIEQSWVTSPCFDFSNISRPMISLDRKISSDRDRDGAVLQYTTDDGDTWKVLGAVDDGSINWYNTFRILNGPGGQGEGWTGGFIFDGNEDWKESRHELDVLIGKPKVQFRIAYAQTDTSVVAHVINEGFAFDNVWIGERSRVVLMEHFTNSALTESNEANQTINKLVGNNALDVIDVQYHAEVDGITDKMNQDNPAPASARSLFYGTRQVPYMLMDGGLSGEMAYDFDENDLDTMDLFTRALIDPSFEIEMDVSEAENKIDITLDIKALEALPEREYIVYVLIVEKLIDDPSYAGAGSVTEFQNVVRDMVPNAAGISLIQEWNIGDTENIPLSWTIDDIILNKEEIYVVSFIQDAETYEVYQAASNDPELNGDPVVTSIREYLQSKELSMVVYPNPANSEAYLLFAEALAGKLEIQLFSHTGNLVRNELLPAGTEMHEMDLSGLQEGVYFIRAMQQGKLIGIQKLMIIK